MKIKNCNFVHITHFLVFPHFFVFPYISQTSHTFLMSLNTFLSFTYISRFSKASVTYTYLYEIFAARGGIKQICFPILLVNIIWTVDTPAKTLWSVASYAKCINQTLLIWIFGDGNYAKCHFVCWIRTKIVALGCIQKKICRYHPLLTIIPLFILDTDVE